ALARARPAQPQKPLNPVQSPAKVMPTPPSSLLLVAGWQTLVAQVDGIAVLQGIAHSPAPNCTHTVQVPLQVEGPQGWPGPTAVDRSSSGCDRSVDAASMVVVSSPQPVSASAAASASARSISPAASASPAPATG